ncbi:hypothetical protein EDB86DRAFT_1316255 [Lactarius hatsudake]|nr:hypothetical protein EDB86DRAFT_1316255 [Lactarius hatsudake]
MVGTCRENTKIRVFISIFFHPPPSSPLPRVFLLCLPLARARARVCASRISRSTETRRQVGSSNERDRQIGGRFQGPLDRARVRRCRPLPLFGCPSVTDRSRPTVRDRRGNVTVRTLTYLLLPAVTAESPTPGPYVCPICPHSPKIASHLRH